MHGLPFPLDAELVGKPETADDARAFLDAARKRFQSRSLEDQLYLESLIQFIDRVFHAWEHGQIDNSRLPAGSPMIYYCRACGCVSASLPECHLGPPPRYCSDCNDMGEERRANGITLRKALGITLPTPYTDKGSPVIKHQG